MKLDMKPGNLETPAQACEVSKPSEVSGRADETPRPARRRRHALESRAASSVSAPSVSGAEKFILLDQLHQEFFRRRSLGEPLDPDVYCAQFPAMKSRLHKLLQAELFLEEHAELFDEDPEIRWPEAGESFLDFHLMLELGRGAFARVFLATEPRLGNRLVAVKIAKHGAGEAEILGRLEHPNIVPVHSVREDETTGLTAVCMPYVGGATLDDVLDKAFPPSCLGPVVARSPDTVVAQPPDTVAARLRDSPKSALLGKLTPAQARVILDAVRDLPHPLDAARRARPETALRKGSYIDGIRLIGAQLAEALAYIHERGICHLDLKPSNVLMSPEGVPMLLDFNLSADANATLNLLGGTIAYMSPEQLRATDESRRARDEERGTKVEARGTSQWLLTPQPSSPAPRDEVPVAAMLDARSDIFSLGVILYQLVTGTHPFGPAPLKLSSVALCRYLLERQQHVPLEARRLNPNVDAAFSRLIQRCLAHDPKDRPQTAAKIATALRHALAPLPRTRRWIGRHPGKVLAAAFLLAAVGLAGIAFAALRPPYSERQIENGLRLYQQGRYSQAVQHFNDALQADPNNKAARFARARAFQQLGAIDKSNYNLAMQDYLEDDERNPDGRSKAALAYCLNRTDGRPELAIGYCQDAIKSGFATAEVFNNLGFNYLRVNQMKEAKQSLDRAIELDSGLQAVYHNRARVALVQALVNMKDLKPMAQENEIYRSVVAGIDDAHDAIARGTASAELYFDAACLCALGARVEQRWLVIALKHVEESINQGFDPEACRIDELFATLRKETTFQELVNRVPSGRPLPPTQRIVDPIRDHGR